MADYNSYNWEDCPAIQGSAQICRREFVPITECGDDAYLDWEGWAWEDVRHISRPVKLQFSRLSHDTNFEVASKLLSGDGFKGFGKYNVCWWSIDIDGDIDNTAYLRQEYGSWLKQFQKHYENFDVDSYLRREFPDLDYCGGETNVVDYFLEQFGSSPVFNTSHSRYGNYRFSFTVEELIEEYKRVMCEDGTDVQYKVFGTIKYAKEVMYAVIICPKTYKRSWPLLKDCKGFVEFEDELPCKWIPQSSGCFIRSIDQDWRSLADPYYQFRRWDHVVFGFYLPEVKSLKMDMSTHEKINQCLYVVDNTTEEDIVIKGDRLSLTDASEKIKSILG